MKEIIIPGTPVTWQRPGLSGKLFYSKHKQAMIATSLFMRSKCRTIPSGGITEVEMTFSFLFPVKKTKPRPGGSLKKIFYPWEKPEFSFKKTRPDLDNLVKFYLDAGNGILWRDDSDVCALTAQKVFGFIAGTRIRWEAG
jgi:Holliday junction resolvase RusA-like endonuclease